MAITYQPVAGEAPTIDPDDARGPWTIELADTSVNGFAVTLKIWPSGKTPITVTALGAGATIEDPTNLGTSAQTINFTTYGVGSVQWIYHQAKNIWGIYGGALLRTKGRGGMETDQQAIGDITAAYAPMIFTRVSQPPHGMTLNPGAGSFTFSWPGWWEFSTQLNLGFTETQSSRFTVIRIYDVTAGTPGPGSRIPIGRNQDGLFFGSTIRFLVAVADIDNVFRLEIGGGDTISGITLYSNVLDFNQQTVSTD